MKTPRLNRKLVLEAREQLPDGSGGYSESWIVLGELWAEVSARVGGERSEGGLPVSQVGYRVVVRATPYGAQSRPSADQRFCDGARHLTILAVAEADYDGRYLACTCTEEIVG